MQKASEFIFFDDGGQLQLPVKLQGETVWLNQKQMGILFDRDYKTIAKHIGNVFKEGELERGATVANFATVQMEGTREVSRDVEYYNLDVIISVGYRVKSNRGVRFRQWASQVLKNYLLQGFAINKELLVKSSTQWANLRLVLEKLSQGDDEQLAIQLTSGKLRNLFLEYAESMVLINQFDEGRLPRWDVATAEAYTIRLTDAEQTIRELKTELMAKGEASELFGHEKDAGGLSAIVGAIYQSVMGEDAYQGIEEKAANLLYFIIKNHPFNDGNKRIGAYLMVWYLEQNGISPPDGDMLVTIALLVAMSDASDKDRMVHLVKILIKNRIQLKN